MFKLLKKLFRFSVKQTGYIHSVPSKTDYVTGGEKSLGARVLIEDGDWTMYEPVGERQNTPFLFDTKSCTTFSFLNALETQLNLLINKGLIPQETLNFLEQYKLNGEINFSDRFLAICAGTTIGGATFTQVAGAARTIGLIPQSMLPYGDAKNWYEWHDPSKITPEMMDKAKEFLKHFDIGYEWVFSNNNDELEDVEIIKLRSELQQSPLQIAVPCPAYHAVQLSWFFDYNRYYTLDSYPPFRRFADWDEEINASFKTILTPKLSTVFTQTLRKGSRGIEVLRLQERLVVAYKTGYFGDLTAAAVKKFQQENNLVADGIVGAKTRAILNS